MSYEQAFKDHRYLWSIGSAVDMTGGYVDQGDLDKLLAAPTKKTAEDCLTSQIYYWFEVGPDLPLNARSANFYVRTDPRVADIADRYAV